MITSQEAILARVMNVSLSTLIFTNLNKRSAHVSIASSTGTLVYSDVTSKLMMLSFSFNLMSLRESQIDLVEQLI